MHELFKRRRSIRKYTSQKITDEQIKEILLAAMVAPSAKDIHPVEFLVVKDREKLVKLSEGGFFLKFIKSASVAIVLIGDPAKNERLWLIDVSIAAAHIYLETVNQGLATCWANVYKGETEVGEDREKFVREVLEIPENKRIVCIMPIGYPSEEIREHSESDYDESKVHWESW